MAYYLLITFTLFFCLTIYEIRTNKVPHKLSLILLLIFVGVHVSVLGDMEQMVKSVGIAASVYLSLLIIAITTRALPAGVVNAITVSVIWVIPFAFMDWMILASILCVVIPALLLVYGKIFPNRAYTDFPIAVVLFASVAIISALQPDFDLTPISSPEQVVAVEPAIPSLRGVN